MNCLTQIHRTHDVNKTKLYSPVKTTQLKIGLFENDKFGTLRMASNRSVDNDFYQKIEILALYDIEHPL